VIIAEFTDGKELRTYRVLDPKRAVSALTLRSFYERRPNEEWESLANDLLKATDLEGSDVAGAEQIHGGGIALVERGGYYAGVDGLMTRVQGIVLTIRVADCLPVYLWDSHYTCIALIHAGWRGAASGIVTNAVRQMIDHLNIEPIEIEAMLGPCICRNCYEVGSEVANCFDASCLQKSDSDHALLDLREAVRTQMIGSGVRAEVIRTDSTCTACRPDHFFSYRRDGAGTGRHIATIALLRN
jgi:YfiH family protein